MGLTENMSFMQSIITFLIGFAIVFICLIAIALFIIISSKIIGVLVKEKVPEVKPATTAASPASSPKVVVQDNQEEVERLAVIISAISEEMREPVENFSIVSITEI